MFRFSLPSCFHKSLIGLLFLVFSQLAMAEDTEIFSSETVSGETNIMVILDNSGSMNEQVDGSSQTRMEALTEAMDTFVSNPEITDINIGLMAFSNGDDTPRPHGVSIPVKPIDEEIYSVMISNTVSSYFNNGINRGFFSLADDNLPDPVSNQTLRAYLPQVVGAWEADGGTPIVDSLHEAALYFRGLSPKWGAVSADQVNAAHPSTYTGSYTSTVTEIWNGDTDECETPTCGSNCTTFTREEQCEEGENECYTNVNCVTKPKDQTDHCYEGSLSACRLSEPTKGYTHCTPAEDDDEECDTVCNGTIDGETGYCIGTVSEVNCSGGGSKLDCHYSSDLRYCDKEEYECEVVEETKNDFGDAIYNSPITQECQSNILILMTDGQPNVSGSQSEADDTRAEIKTMIGSASDCADVAGQVSPNTADNTLSDGRCGVELARYLANNDQNPSVDGDNTVKTFTVGFAVDALPNAEAYLKALAAAGDGKYFSANNSAALAAAFTSILNESVDSDRSFASPVYTVDPASLLANSEDIYLPLFKNSELPRWSGNLKKFKMNDAGEIVDTTGSAAFDSLGQLRPDAIDFWMPTGATADADADSITSGGFANNLNPASRKLLTDNGSALVTMDSSTVTKSLLGNSSMSDDDATKLINYAKGYAVDGTARGEIGDILHSKPTLISYGDRQVLFFGTNEGFLHAVNAADAADGGGTEEFAYMPSGLLKNIQGNYDNAPTAEGELSRIYGVDGNITAHIVDNNLNGKVDGSDTATLIFGLRRGGNAYYALDVTDPDSPELKWSYTESNLGETWSKAVPAKLKYLKSGSVVLANVLVFGGGYDNRLDEEDASARTNLANTKGNSVSIIDLETGDLIWSYGGNKLTNSIPGDIRSIDIDGDGSIDRLYFGDTGGDIWRVDLNALENEPGHDFYDIENNAQLFHFAELGGSGIDKRKFFFAPDVSIFKESGQERLILAIGSGYRSHPLNQNIDDRFYVLSDEDVRSIPATSKAALDDGDIVISTSITDSSFLTNHKGWYKALTTGLGEKVLAAPLTFMQKIAFTTFAVSDGQTVTDASGCTVSSSNLASAYVLDLLTGSATADLNGDGVINDDDESVVVPNGAILDTPQLVFNEPSNCTNEGCDHIIDIRVGKMSTPIVGGDTLGGNTNIGDYLPKVFWIGQ